MPRPPEFWAHGAPKEVAGRTPVHGLTGWGSRQRRATTGGCANGMPLNTALAFERAALNPAAGYRDCGNVSR